MAEELRGLNQIETFRGVAEKLATEISKREGVAAIVFLGGLVRGFMDRFSDMDITVFLRAKDEQLRRQICDLGMEWERRAGIDADLEVHFLEDFERWKWDEVDKWEFSKAEIVFDPKAEIRKVFAAKLRLPKDFWLRRIAICCEYLKWYSCPTREGVGTIAEAWIARGDPVNAHYCLNYSVDLILRVIFAINKEHLPAPKWRLYYSYRLKWLPETFKERVTEAMRTRDLSTTDFGIRLKAIRQIWQSIQPRIRDETGLTPDEISKYYVKAILHLGRQDNINHQARPPRQVRRNS